MALAAAGDKLESGAAAWRMWQKSSSAVGGG